MALQESDREDLMREATALVERMELQFDDEPESLIFGYRRQGELSCFFGADPVYHFDGAMQIKRAYIDGELYRTQGTTLARLTRERTTNPETARMKTVLQRHDLGPDELLKFREQALAIIEGLKARIEANEFTILRRVPEAVELIPRLTKDLQTIIEQELSLGPRFKGKR